MKDSKTLRIVVDIVLIVLGFIFLGFGIKDAIDKYNREKTPDAITFKRSYGSVDDDNPYVYINSKEYDKLTSSETGVVLVANPNDPRAQVVVKPLAQIVDDYEVDVIYYLEVEEDDELQIIVIKDGEELVHLSKSDIFAEEYDGILIEYFKDALYYDSFKESLKDIEKLK